MLTDLPNVLTLSRIAAIPLLVVLVVLGHPATDLAACILFSTAAITDWLDGHLARTRRQQSELGRMLDPIADKLLVGAALMLLVGHARLSHWGLYPAIVIMLREILVSGLREYLAGIRIGLPVTRLAKWKTGFQMGALGTLLHVRGRYGHGGRPGYEREWRADPAVAGGGELLDQGVHLIDLARWFAGDFVEVSGHVATYFWDMPVEDNGFLLLRTATGQSAWLHASCTEWKNLFCFEVFGRDGKLQIDGLGGSYGVERLAFYRMLPQMGPPETTIWEYPGEDHSWRTEFTHFIECIRQGGQPNGTLNDALAALEVVQHAYDQAAAPFSRRSQNGALTRGAP